MESRGTVEVGEATIEYGIHGTGDSVVLIPGGGIDFSYYDDLAQALVHAGYQAVVVNQRGMGASTGSLDGLTLDTLAADVAGVIDALHCAPVHILGHAYGSLPARCLAADRPDLVRSVILLAARGHVQADPAVQARLRHWYRAEATESECLEALGEMLADASRAPAIWRQVTRWPLAGAAQSAAMRATPRDDWLGAPGGMPYLLVQGREDRFATVSYAQALRAQYGHRIHVVEIPHAGHVLPLEQPKAVAEAVIAFLRKQA